MMAQGAQRMDAAVRPGARRRPASARHVAQPAAAAGDRAAASRRRSAARERMSNAYQVQITGKDVNFYNFAMAHLRTLPGIDSATPQQINPGGDELRPGHLSRATSPSLRRRSARAGGWSIPPAPWSASAPTSDKPPALPPPPCSRPAARSRAAATSNSAAASRDEAGPRPDRAPARLAAKRRRCPLHRLRRQSRGVRSFPPLEHVAGQGDDPHRSAALGPHACWRAASSSESAAACSTMPTAATRRSCSTPGTRRRTRAARWSWSPIGCRRPGRRACPT